ncbi:MAG: anthranilate phosphoribosyltransferase [Phycisphaerales bacterium]|nr:anthranilate phosphoribosyltransferase [Phycisphaerales bacterium]
MENLNPIHVFQSVMLATSENTSLTSKQVDEALTAIFSGGVETSLIEKWLRLVSTHVPTTAEIFGGVRALLRTGSSIPTDIACERIIDTAGTGGAPKMLNVSTLSAVIIAACRGVVAKSGNRSRTGFGSSETLAALGVNIQAEPITQARMLAECGFCFCLAPKHYPAARFASEARKAIGTPTLFNAIGPLSNPAGAMRQVVGVWNRDLLTPVAEVLARRGAVRAFVIHSADGFDEVSVSDQTHAVEVVRGRVMGNIVFEPEQFGIPRSKSPPQGVQNLQDATTLFRRLASGIDCGGALDLVLVNAALGLMVADKANDPKTAAALALDAIQSGRVNSLLERIVVLSNQ